VVEKFLSGLSGILQDLAGFIGELSHHVQSLEKCRGELALTGEVTSLEPQPPVQADQTQVHLAAILAALQEFTGLPSGSFQIDKIECLGDAASVRMKAHIAAIAAAIHEFTSLPVESFRIVGVKPIGTVNMWKMAGRLELMGLEMD
jgi:hypothetical protein